jgi:hypothetical protein
VFILLRRTGLRKTGLRKTRAYKKPLLTERLL